MLAAALLVALTAPVVGAYGPATATDQTQVSASATVDTEDQPVTGVVVGDEGPSAYQQQAEENNSTRHVDPDAVNEAGDLEGVSAWLEGRLTSQLVDNQIQISSRLADDADGLFDEEFERRLGQYVDVAGETDREESSDEVQNARENQTDLENEVQTYEELRSEYRAARRQGDDQRAREIARELQRTAERINDTGDNLEDTYETLGNRTDVDTTPAIQELNALESDIQENVSEITDDLFVTTRLSVDVESEMVSFLNPVQLQGVLRTTNGTGVGSRQVTVQIGDRTYQAQTNESGAFDTRIRPTTLPTGLQELEVQYLPDPGGEYLGANDTVTVDVRSVEGSVTLRSVPESLRFDEAATISGTVGAEGVGAEGVPVVVSVDGRELGQTQTTQAGEFAVDIQLPAGVESGDTELQVSVPLEDRALRVPPASTSVEIQSTDTRLTVGTNSSDQTIRVQGQLQTVSGTSVGGQPVTVTVDGNSVARVVTDAEGRYSETVTVDVPAGTNRSVPVTVEYGGTGTNLASAENSTRETLAGQLGGPGDESTDGGQIVFQLFGTTISVGIPMLVGGSALALVLLLAGGLFVFGRTTSGESPSPGSNPSQAAGTGGGDGGADEPGSKRDSDDVSLAKARLGDDDYDGAVRIAYRRARSVVATRHGLEDGGTHQEFLERCRGNGVDGEDLSLLETLTETYERAAFAPGTVAVSGARKAVETAEQLAPDRAVRSDGGGNE